MREGKEGLKEYYGIRRKGRYIYGSEMNRVEQLIG